MEGVLQRDRSAGPNGYQWYVQCLRQELCCRSGEDQCLFFFYEIVFGLPMYSFFSPCCSGQASWIE